MATIALGPNYNSFKVTRAHSNLDYWYGPYNSVEEANILVPLEVRGLGLTVGIKQFTKNDNGIYSYVELTDEFGNIYHTYVEDLDNLYEGDRYTFLEVEEYLWKRNTTTLEKKGESSLVIERITAERIRISENVPLQILIYGGIAPNSIEVYEVRNNLEFLTDYGYPGVIPINSPISLNLNISGEPRTIIYRIKVTDKNNLYAKTIDGNENYIQITVDFKEAALTNLNTNEIDRLTIKNANNLLGKSFSFHVSYIAEFVQSYNVSLYIGENLIENVIESLGGDNHRVTLPDDLNAYGGLDIKIKLLYTRIEDNGETSTIELYYNIVTIMARGIFSNIKTELLGNTFYFENKVPCKIYFEAESQTTYSIASTENSDFEYFGLIESYKWNLIYINPLVITENPRFIFKIDGIKEVIVNTESNSRITEFTKTVFSDDSRIPDDPRTYDNNISSMKSFILDIYCFINWTNSLDTIFRFANITINKELIRFGNIVYPTPLQRDIHIGFEFQVTDDNLGQSGNVYNALYIDGVLCKNEKITSPIGGIVVNNIQFTNDFIIKNIYSYINSNKYLYPFTNRTFINSTKFIPILLNNYEYYVQKEDEQNNLPILKLTALDLDDDKYTIRNEILGRKKAIIPSMFGTLEDGQNKYPLTVNTDSEPCNVLLKLRTSLKSKLQKSRGVICQYEYGNETGYVEVHTQGTSTLDYRLPNFKFTFLGNDMNKKKVNFVSGYSESVLTAKTDYMDSSHLNNTPTATYYNKIIRSGFFLEDNDYRSPSAKNNGLDAITGIPIIMQIKDVGSQDYINYGSFMLNIDKTGDALKFKVEEGIDECISFEGTSNDFVSGLSSRFIIDLSALNDFLLIHNSLEDPNISDDDFYSEINDDGDYIINKSDISEESDIQNKNILISMINVLKYLAQGLEYRYPDSGIISDEEDSEEYYTIMPFPHFKRLFDMFYWVANSSNLTKDLYRELFVRYFNYEYCALYFINLMGLALTDNLGKNCMFDLWFDPFGENNNKDCLWYPRPYDLDSQAGLENRGYDGVAPFVEISPEFSLNYEDVINNWDGIENKQEYLERNYLSSNTLLRYPDTNIPEYQEQAKRYHYSSSTSNLWINFFINFKEDIRRTYRDLRNYKVNNSLVYDPNGTNTLLSANTIINFYKEQVIDKLGDGQYNLDFLLKYLGDPDKLFFGYGNRWNKFKDWINKRILFCDIYFYYRVFDVTLSEFNKTLLLDSPLYVITRHNLDNGVDTVYFFNGIDPINVTISGNGTASSGLRYLFYINPESIILGDIYNSIASSIPRLPLNSIINLNIKGLILTNVVDITGSTYLSTLNISQLNGSYNEQLPSNIKTITITDSQQFPVINNLPYLELITIDGCESNGGILNLSDLGTDESPITLTIRNSTLGLNLTNVKIREFTSVGNTINQLTINNCDIPSLVILNLNINNVAFTGNSSNILIIDFRNSTFYNSSIDLSIVATNVKHLLLSDTKGLTTITSNNRFESLKFIGLMNSEILNFVYTKSDENNTIDHFDGKLLPDNLPRSLYCLSYNELGSIRSAALYQNPIIYNSSRNDYLSGTSSATMPFSLEQTKIVKIINLNVYDSNLSSESLGGHTSNVTGVTKLFSNCRELISIEDCDIRCSGVKMFRCCCKLSSITNSTIKIGTDATYMFTYCDSLNYSYIDAILDNNPQITNFTLFLFTTLFSLDTTIDLSKYANATDMTRAFCFPTSGYYGVGNRPITDENRITMTFTGTIPTNVTTLVATFHSGGNYMVFTDWNNLIKNCNSLTNMGSTFCGCRKLGTAAKDYYELTTDWFPYNNDDSNPNYLSLTSTFASANVKLAESFKFKRNVYNCKNTFYGCGKYTNQQHNVTNIFEDCDKLECALQCFYNTAWAYTSGPLVLNSINEVSICGIFAISSISSRNNYCDVYGAITGRFTLSTNEIYPINNGKYNCTAPNSNNVISDPPGIFARRNVTIRNNILINYTSSNLTNLFRESKIILSDVELDHGVLKVKLTSPIINSSFYNTIITDNRNKNNTSVLNVTLENTEQASYAFAVSDKTYYLFETVNLECKPPILPNSIIDASYMFSGQSINVIDKNYFRSNDSPFSNLTNTSYMFLNTNLKNLPYDSTYGLLPPSITNMDYMFYNCTKLKGGIPKNFFNNNTLLTKLQGTFGRTGVLFEVNSNYTNIFSPLDLKTLLPNVDNVSYLFHYNYLTNMPSPYLKIDSHCFENCKTLDYLFYNSKEGLATNSLVDENGEVTNDFYLNAPVSMEFAFTGFSRYLKFRVEDKSKLQSIKAIAYSFINYSHDPEIDDMSNSIYLLLRDLKDSGRDLINDNTLILDSCLGKWSYDLSELSVDLGITDTDESKILHWYSSISSLPGSRGTTIDTN